MIWSNPRSVRILFTCVIAAAIFLGSWAGLEVVAHQDRGSAISLAGVILAIALVPLTIYASLDQHPGRRRPIGPLRQDQQGPIKATWQKRRLRALAVLLVVAFLGAVVVWGPPMIMRCPPPPWRHLSSPTSPELPIASRFPAPGEEPTGLTFDGTHLWITDGAYAIFRVGLDGQIFGSYEPTNPTPEGITWDGLGFWLFTTNRSTIDNFRIDSSKTTTLGSIDPPSRLVGGGLPHDLAWDGEALWLAEQYNAYRISTTGTVLGQFTKGDNIAGIEINGDDVWLGYDSFPDGAVIELADHEGRTRRTFSAAVYGLTALAWADGTLWGLGLEEFAGEPYIYRFDVIRGLTQPSTLPSPTAPAQANASPDQPPSPTGQATTRC